MREIAVSQIRDTVSDLCLKANFELRKDVLGAIKRAYKKETNARAKGILKTIVENARVAKDKKIAICQDTGMVSVFLDIGIDVRITGGNLEDAVNDGVRKAYDKGYLRKSVVDDPLLRNNTRTNTPCVIFTDIVDGDKMKVTISPKGFGSENKSKIRMFNPTSSVEDIKKFVIDVVKNAGPDACPPLVLGIGIGGTFEKAAYLAKKALTNPIDKSNARRHISKLEKELEIEINALGIGPMGLGGKTTVFGVNILEYPTHIAGLPVAVNVSCHATRGASKIL
ncbi:MAG: fumarate hydratase [Candidatus Omnitrophica bacterium]|nr:fumarate hydratase [Candidatus Omnitrophota bacterium]